MDYDNDFITRAASVTLKERRRLVLVARETLLSCIRLKNMLETKAVEFISAPIMAFYTRPKDIVSMVNQSVRRMVDALNVNIDEQDMLKGEHGFNGGRKQIHDVFIIRRYVPML